MSNSSEFDDLFDEAADEDGILIDLSEASEERDFAPFKGRREAVVESVTRKPPKDASGANKMNLVFRFKITDDENTGRVVFKHCPTAGPGAGIARDVIKALGGELVPGKAFAYASLTGAECVIDCVPDGDQVQVKRVFPAAQ